MTAQYIETYLSFKNTHLDIKIKNEIEKNRLLAIKNQNEVEANYFWCLKKVFEIQEQFLSAFASIKKEHYEDAWLTLERVDIALGILENNFDVFNDTDKFHVVFIGKIVKEYQKLFPYQYFFSRENIIKKEKCSICGKIVSLRNSCKHKPGKLYMGELCSRHVIDMEPIGISLVTDPFDKYGFIQIPDREYNYGMLSELMDKINYPYEEFYIETIKEKAPQYKNVGRNEKCPCGSGKKYKKCHLGTEEELIEHYIIHLPNQKRLKAEPAKYFGTWK